MRQRIFHIQELRNTTMVRAQNRLNNLQKELETKQKELDSLNAQGEPPSMPVKISEDPGNSA